MFNIKEINCSILKVKIIYLQKLYTYKNIGHKQVKVNNIYLYTYLKYKQCNYL